MKKEIRELLSVVLVLCITPAAMGGIQATPQPAAASGAGSFPEAYLEGTPDFNLVLQIHGDLRGNYGPCG